MLGNVRELQGYKSGTCLKWELIKEIELMNIGFGWTAGIGFLHESMFSLMRFGTLVLLEEIMIKMCNLKIMRGKQNR